MAMSIGIAVLMGHGNYDRINKAVAKQNIAGRWNHWAFTKNAVTGRMAIYLNGSLFMTDTGKHKQINLKKLDLGLSATSTLGYYGKVSRFTVWNKALDSEFHQADHAARHYSCR